MWEQSVFCDCELKHLQSPEPQTAADRVIGPHTEVKK